MNIQCVWEHNGCDSLLYAVDLPGAYARGESLEIAMKKMESEARAYFLWRDGRSITSVELSVVQEAPSGLQICDADSDVLFDAEKAALSMAEYTVLKELSLKSAADFYTLHLSIPDKLKSDASIRNTFYGQVPRTADEMYQHTRNVNSYYFGEIDVDADNDDTILDCCQRGFERLEQEKGFLNNSLFEGSYGELWTLRKVLRRFIWHDRIHAKAMYRMAIRMFGKDNIKDVFCFGEHLK